MFLVGQRVDDSQSRRGRGEPLDPMLAERADHDAEHPALEIARDVFQRLATAEDDVGWRLDDVAAELANRDHELDRVRSDGFSNSNATCCPASGVACGRPACRAAFIEAARSSTSRPRPA